MHVRIFALAAVLALTAAVAHCAAPPPMMQVHDRGIALMLELAGRPEHRATDFAEQIHKIAGPQHVRQLLAATHSENARVRWTGLSGLIGLCLYTPPMVEELYIPLAKRMVDDGDKDVRERAEQLYFNCAGYSEDLTRVVIEKCKRALADNPDRATKRMLISALAHGGPKSDAGMAYLDSLIDDLKGEHRFYAFLDYTRPWTVRTFKSRSPLDHCREFLTKNSDPGMVQCSFQVLAELKPKDREFRSWILKNASGPTVGSPEQRAAIQQQAIVAGSRIGGDKEFVALLRKMIADEKADVETRLASVYALGALKHEALPALPELKKVAAEKRPTDLRPLPAQRLYQMQQAADEIVTNLSNAEPPVRKR